jgi:hypothetical protein
MSVKERFSQELDVYTDEEWDKGNDDDQEWSPALRVEYPSQVKVKKETPRG